jgi:hypothetical protein
MTNTVLWIAGGLTVGVGLVNLLMGAFAVPGGDVALVFGTLGYDGLDDLQLTIHGKIGIPCFLAGAAMMIVASKDAWKTTGGY